MGRLIGLVVRTERCMTAARVDFRTKTPENTEKNDDQRH